MNSGQSWFGLASLTRITSGIFLFSLAIVVSAAYAQGASCTSYVIRVAAALHRNTERSAGRRRSSKFKPFHSLVLLFFGIAAAQASPTPNSYSCRQVDVPGAKATSIWRFNNIGNITANSTVGPYIYNPNTGAWIPLPAPPAASGYAATDLAIYDINDQGTIVGSALNPSVNGGLDKGFILRSITDASTYSFYSYADAANPTNNDTVFRGISNNGLIAGYASLSVAGTVSGVVFNPTNAAIGSFAPGFAPAFNPVLSDGSTAIYTLLNGINSSGLIVGNSQSYTIAEGIIVGPDSFAVVPVPNAGELSLRGINDADPFSAGNCDAGSCVRTAGFTSNATGGESGFRLDYDPKTHYIQGAQTLDCSAQIPASANSMVTEGINNSDTIATNYSDAAGNSHGIIAYLSTTVPASSCSASEGGCNLSNGAIPHTVVGGPNPLPGTVTETDCKIKKDPRIVQYGTCTGHTLPVAQVCPGFGKTVIPDFLCGGAGPSGSAFELVDTVAEGVDALSGIYVESEAFADVGLGGTPAACPETVVGWGPRSASSVEGIVPEGDNMLELTTACGSSKTNSRGLSIYAVGLKLNTDALSGQTLQEKLKTFTTAKYENLYQSIAAGNIVNAERLKLNACVESSQLLFAAGKLCKAARAIAACDSQVAVTVGEFSGSPSDPNVWGDIRGRLGNLYLTINTRLAGNPPNNSWPPTNLPSCQ